MARKYVETKFCALLVAYQRESSFEQLQPEWGPHGSSAVIKKAENFRRMQNPGSNKQLQAHALIFEPNKTKEFIPVKRVPLAL